MGCTVGQPADAPSHEVSVAVIGPLPGVPRNTTSTTLDSGATRTSARSSSKNSTDSLRKTLSHLLLRSEEPKHDEPKEEDHEDHWPELLFGEQADRRDSESFSKPASPSPAKLAYLSPAKLASASPAKFASPSKLSTGSNATGVSDSRRSVFAWHKDEPPEDCWPERLCGQNDDKPPEWTKSTIWAEHKSRQTSKVSVKERQSQERSQYGHLPLPMFDSLTKEELRDITVEILSGMLIALADSGNALFGVKALPFDSSVALMRCKREIDSYRRRPMGFILASADLVVLFSSALLDAGVSKAKISYVARCLRRENLDAPPASIKKRLSQKCDEFTDVVKTARSAFLVQKWDEFGYAAGRIAMYLAN